MIYQPQLSEEYLALCQIIPAPQGWKGCSSKLWNQLEVRHEKIEKELRIREMVFTYLAGIPESFLNLVALKCEIDPFNLSDPRELEGKLVDVLADEYLSMTDQRWLTDVFLLDAFVKNKHHRPVRRVAEAIIGKDRFKYCEKVCGRDNDALRLALCSIAYFLDPTNLTLIYLYERAERFGYNRYNLIPNDNVVIQQGIDLGKVDQQVVESALKALDQITGQKVISRCFGIYTESHRVTVFVKRQFRPAKIVEADQTLFGDEADPIVLRFSDRLLELEERSEQQISHAPVGKRIADEIATLLISKNARYEEVVSKTEVTNLRLFLDNLREDLDDALHLVEITLSQAPIPGQPKLSIRGNELKDLKPSLQALKEKGVDLLADPGLISRLVVSFRWASSVLGGKTADHQFTLHLHKFDPEQFVIRYSQMIVETEKREAFEKYIKAHYGIIASPKTSRGRP